MSKTKKQRVSNSISQWQSDKMRSILVERWEEVWEVVETRSKKKITGVSAPRKLITPLKYNPIK